MKLRWKKGTAGGQRGAFIVFTALAMWFLMIFVAFAVDFGNFYRHRSQLQNAADAAALAGVAEYTTEEIAANSVVGAVAAPTLSQGRLIKVVDSDKATTPSGGVRRSAQDYVNNNYGNLDIKNNKVWSEKVTEEKTENGVKQTVTTTHRYCRVDLEDSVQTFFARIFGVDSLTVKASALAMLDGSANDETWGKRLQGIAERMEKLAPDQIWETIVYNTNPYNVTDSEEPENDQKSTKNNYGYGEFASRYYTVTGTSPNLLYLGEEETKAVRTDMDGNVIIGYIDSDDGVCAKPIPALGSVPYGGVTTKVFWIHDAAGVTWNMGKNNNMYAGEIFAIYLNRDHITNNNKIPNSNVYRTGATDRFTKIIVDAIHGSDYNPNSYMVPLYARLESETIRIGYRGLMPVNGVFVEVRLTEAELAEGKIKPFVLAYDGPDQNRGKGPLLVPGKPDAEDAPWIAQKNVTIEKEMIYKKNKRPKQYFSSDLSLAPGQIEKDNCEAWLASEKNSDPYVFGGEGWTYEENKAYLVGKGMVLSAMTTSGPIEVFIDKGKVFYGSIYAPRSRVILKGRGKIYGFIAAREIIDEEMGAPRTIYRSERIKMPTLVPVIKNRDKGIFDYVRVYIEAEYDMAFTKYEDFTDEKYYKDVIGN